MTAFLPNSSTNTKFTEGSVEAKASNFPSAKTVKGTMAKGGTAPAVAAPVPSNTDNSGNSPSSTETVPAIAASVAKRGK